MHNYINWMLLLNWLAVKLATLAFLNFIGTQKINLGNPCISELLLLLTGAVTTPVTHGSNNFFFNLSVQIEGWAGLIQPWTKERVKIPLAGVGGCAVSASSGEYLITAQEAAVISCPAIISAVPHWGLCAAECSPWRMSSLPVPLPERSIVQCEMHPAAQPGGQPVLAFPLSPPQHAAVHTFGAQILQAAHPADEHC